jgi:hypothetical protein
MDVQTHEQQVDSHLQRSLADVVWFTKPYGSMTVSACESVSGGEGCNCHDHWVNRATAMTTGSIGLLASPLYGSIQRSPSGASFYR